MGLKQKLNFLKLNPTYYFLSNLQCWFFFFFKVFWFCKHETHAKCLLPLLLLCCFSFSHSPEQNPPPLHQQLIPSHRHPSTPTEKPKHRPHSNCSLSLSQDQGRHKTILLCIYDTQHKCGSNLSPHFPGFSNRTAKIFYHIA